MSAPAAGREDANPDPPGWPSAAPDVRERVLDELGKRGAGVRRAVRNSRPGSLRPVLREARRVGHACGVSELHVLALWVGRLL